MIRIIKNRICSIYRVWYKICVHVLFYFLLHGHFTYFSSIYTMIPCMKFKIPCKCIVVVFIIHKHIGYLFIQSSYRRDVTKIVAKQ